MHNFGRQLLAKPETPEGYEFFKYQLKGLLRDYPQISGIFPWARYKYRDGGAFIVVKIMPEKWKGVSTMNVSDRNFLRTDFFGMMIIILKMKTMKNYLLAILILSLFSIQIIQGQVMMDISPDNFDSWEQIGEGTWAIKPNKEQSSLKGAPPTNLIYWNSNEKTSNGILKSQVFTINKPFQVFDIAGVWGRHAIGGPGYSKLQLVSYPTGEILRETLTNNYPYLSEERWATHDLIGQKVRLQIYSPTLYAYFGNNLRWVALENYRQIDDTKSPDYVDKQFQAPIIDENSSLVYCRSIPFLSTNPSLREDTNRRVIENEEMIPINATANKLFFLGMLNHGWEHGVAHWSEHPELQKHRTDQNYIGNNIGTIRIQYVDGSNDTVPLVVGSTVWFSSHWAHGASHDVSVPCQEPFASRPELMEVLKNTLTVYESDAASSFASEYKHFYLVVEPANKKIENIIIEDDELTRGTPLISGISLMGKRQKNLHSFGNVAVDPADYAEYYDVERPLTNISERVENLANVLYNKASDLPENPELIPIPAELNATSIRFIGSKEASWLSNVWAANLIQINEKFNAQTGRFAETGKDTPFYGGYSGIGTWSNQGIYPSSYSRTSDHYVTLALRHIDNPMRETSFVDYCDYYLYFYRNNHDLEKGPPNEKLDLNRYPDDAPPHWSMELDNPPGGIPVNEIFGDEEMDGQASTIIARWFAWRLQGGTKMEWLTKKRDSVFGKSRWESTKDAVEFICYLMDYTGMDLVYSEGEFTGWGGVVNNFCLVPEGMSEETDPVKIRKNYANANMYEPYPNFACMTALRCAAEMADSANHPKLAEKWNGYAERIKEAMLRQLIAGDFNELTWRISPYSILTTFQDRLVQAFFSLYGEGLDTREWDQEMLKITRNTFKEHLEQPYGYQPALAMGYGQGWFTHAALVLDEMDAAGQLLVNIAKYSYDKNMDYADETRGIDWKKWAWIIPEGVNILPDGSWHRINDLSNGANQGPAMHAIEASSGVDDSNPMSIKIMPRIADPLKGILVKNHTVLINEKDKFAKAKINYRYTRNGSFKLESDKVIPEISVRFGPFNTEEQYEGLVKTISDKGYNTHIEVSGTYKGNSAKWVWVTEIQDVEVLEL